MQINPFHKKRGSSPGKTLYSWKSNCFLFLSNLFSALLSLGRPQGLDCFSILDSSIQSSVILRQAHSSAIALSPPIIYVADIPRFPKPPSMYQHHTHYSNSVTNLRVKRSGSSLSFYLLPISFSYLNNFQTIENNWSECTCSPSLALHPRNKMLSSSLEYYYPFCIQHNDCHYGWQNSKNAPYPPGRLLCVIQVDLCYHMNP